MSRRQTPGRMSPRRARLYLIGSETIHARMQNAPGERPVVPGPPTSWLGWASRSPAATLQPLRQIGVLDFLAVESHTRCGRVADRLSLDIMFHRDDDVPLFVSLVHVAMSLDHLLQRIPPVNHRLQAPLFNEFLEQDQIPVLRRGRSIID